jgi:hypothetical protein
MKINDMEDQPMRQHASQLSSARVRLQIAFSTANIATQQNFSNILFLLQTLAHIFPGTATLTLKTEHHDCMVMLHIQEAMDLILSLKAQIFCFLSPSWQMMGDNAISLQSHSQ